MTATSTVSYITPTVWYAHFIAYSEAKLYEHLILVIAIEKLKKYTMMLFLIQSQKGLSVNEFNFDRFSN